MPSVRLTVVLIYEGNARESKLGGRSDRILTVALLLDGDMVKTSERLRRVIAINQDFGGLL
jgi:hypothetical protein